MNTPIPVSEYIRLGRVLQTLHRPDTVTTEAYVQQVQSLFSLLKICELPNAAHAATSLGELNIPNNPRVPYLMTPTAAQQLQHMMSVIQKAIDNDSTPKNTIVLDRDGVSKRLGSVRVDFHLTQTQTHLVEETIRCMECGALRSAIVMGWNFAFDFIRQWTFDKHLPAFNVALTVLKKGTPFDPINSYEDFFQRKGPTERNVIDILQSANLIGGKVYDHLCESLRQRNDYAHPNFKTPSLHQTNAYVENLIELISAAPFK